MPATTHKKYSASGASRFFKCAASIKACASVPARPSGPSALDGQDAHALIEFALMGGVRSAPVAYALGKFNHEFRTDSYDVRMDSVQACLDYVYSLLDMYPDAELHLEVSFDFPSNVAPGECGGTSDIVILIPSIEFAYVIDYKNGIGVVVEIEDNPQVLTYGNGVIAGLDPQGAYRFFGLVIIQPRAWHKDGPVREWYTDRQTVLDFIPVHDAKVRACEEKSPVYTPGEEQCQFCDAATTCPAIEARALSIAGTDFKSVKDVTAASLPAPSSLPLERIAYILQAASVLQTWLTNVETLAYQLAMSGQYIPEHKLVEAQAKRTWDDNREEIAENLMLYLGTDDLDIVMPRRLMTITDAEAALKRHFRAVSTDKKRGSLNKMSQAASEVMAQWTTKSSSGTLKLVHVSDTRPPVDRAQRDFQTVKTIDGTATRT